MIGIARRSDYCRTSWKRSGVKIVVSTTAWLFVVGLLYLMFVVGLLLVVVSTTATSIKKGCLLLLGC